jgi:hypothetical protein
VTSLTAEPAQERAFQEFGIKPIGLRPAVLARNGYARRMNGIRFKTSGREPTHQPETVPTALTGHHDTINLMASFDCFIAPTHK